MSCLHKDRSRRTHMSGLHRDKAQKVDPTGRDPSQGMGGRPPLLGAPFLLANGSQSPRSMTWHFTRIDDMALHADRWHGTSRGSMMWCLLGLYKEGAPQGFYHISSIEQKLGFQLSIQVEVEVPLDESLLVSLVLDLVHLVLYLVRLVLHILRLIHQVVKGERRREPRRSRICPIFLNIVKLNPNYSAMDTISNV